MNMQEYLRLPALSSGICHTLLTRSPFHAWFESAFNANRPFDASAAADIGTYAHACLLEGSFDALVICPFDDWRKKEAQAMRDDARAAGKTPILERKVSEVRAMVDAARAFVADSELSGVFDTGAPEQTLRWQEGDTPCKARPDWLTEDHSILLHVKTTQGSAEPNAWIRNQMIPMGYDVAAAFYERGLYATPGNKDAPTSVFLVIEQNAPYGCSLVGLSEQLAELSAAKVGRAIALWQQCAASNRWPSYPNRIAYAEAPAWTLNEWEEREAMREHIDPLQQLHGIQA